MTASYYTEALPKNFPEGRFAAKCIYSKIKSAGFAFPGDVSLTLNMTNILAFPIGEGGGVAAGRVQNVYSFQPR